MALRSAIDEQPQPSVVWLAPPPAPPPAGDWRLLLYNLLLTFAAPALAGYALWRIISRGKSRTGWAERFGFVPPSARYRPGGPRIWVHGVSVGEIGVTARLLEAIQRHLPTAQVLVTTTTPTGRAVAAKSCPAAQAVFYFPFDFMPAVERALRLVRPDLCLLIEGELWPNFISAAARRGAATVVVNGRISNRTLRRLLLLGPLFHWVVRRVDRFCMQSDRDAQRIVRVGADPARVSNLGNIKFDQTAARVPPDERARIARELGVADARTVVIAASTHPGEEEIALRAFHTIRQVDPGARLIIAPRQLQRAAEVEQLVAQAGLRSRRRTQGSPAAAEGPNTVVILDTIGELGRVYSVATIAFVGGSFAPIGGHNILEAAAQGVPSVFGPIMHNFRDIANTMIEAGLGFEVPRPEDLGPAMARLLEDRRRLEDIDRGSERVLACHRGAADRCAQAAVQMLGYRPPVPPASAGDQFGEFVVSALSGYDRSIAARLLVAAFAPDSLLYWVGLKINRLAYDLGLLRTTRLTAPVISVGNLTAGGTGKTSAAAALAAATIARGKRPAILSRGYGRQRGRGCAVVSDGARVLADHLTAGDEPVLLASSVPGAAVLVGKDRRESGRRAIEDLHADVLILDDGFQYWRLEKDREIVLIDALAPFGTGLLFPAGILREPLSHLRRADEVWLTHTDLAGADRVNSVRARLQRCFNGPIMDTIHAPVELRPLDRAEPMSLAELQGKRVVAMSGIGNPLAFELTLRRLGAQVLPVRFPDHHHYSPADRRAVERFAQRRQAIIITTEKDAVRLGAGAFSAPAWALRVRLIAAHPGVDLILQPEPHPS
jgi:tetraacyldisaccharide 4'-kinase